MVDFSNWKRVINENCVTNSSGLLCPVKTVSGSLFLIRTVNSKQLVRDCNNCWVASKLLHFLSRFTARPVFCSFGKVQVVIQFYLSSSDSSASIFSIHFRDQFKIRMKTLPALLEITSFGKFTYNYWIIF
ncbi:hypothetical protein Gasu2_06170 [Galdieria sulphuraria]|nr:hypothetical protein Gasu2_06170 [Galdieria sulphuraria]